MNNRNWTILGSLLALSVTSAPAQDAARAEAVGIVQDIVRVCQEQGMLRCEPQIRGADVVFDYIRLFDQVDRLDQTFALFVQQRYPDAPAVDLDVLQASLKLSLEITFTPEQFTQRIRAVKAVPAGYDIEMAQGDVLALRQQEGVWRVRMPSTVASQFNSLQQFYLAGELKRSILTYRMLEADMAQRSRDELEAAVSEDLAPVVVAVLGEERVPAALRWLTKDLSTVVRFYRQFSSIEDMRAHIRKAHNL